MRWMASGCLARLSTRQPSSRAICSNWACSCPHSCRRWGLRNCLRASLSAWLRDCPARVSCHHRHSLSRVRKSDSGTTNCWWAWSAACCWSSGRSRTSAQLSAATRTSASASAALRLPSISMRPWRASTGRRASCRPVAVRERCSSMAPSSMQACQASPSKRLGGASTNGNCSGSPRPRASISSTTPTRPARWISGSVNSGRQEIGLVEQPDAGAGADPAAAAGALVARSLRDRLDRQAQYPRMGGIARDSGQARVDHEPDARHGQRSLGHVGGQHDAPSAPGLEDTILARLADAHTAAGSRCAPERPGAELRETWKISRSPGRNTRISPRPSMRLTLDRRRDAPVGPGLRHRSASGSDINRVAAPFDRDHGSIVEVPGKALGVDGR
jgi:hypothetical protein